MPQFEFSRWDGSQDFSPQSADKVFDQLSEYLLDYGDEVLPMLSQLEDENPDLLEKLIKQGYIEKDAEGRFQVTPRGIKRIESRALDELFQVTARDKLGIHEIDQRGVGQTVHEDCKPYEYGDPVANLNMHETLRNALHRQGGGSPIQIEEDDLVVHNTEYQTSCATVVLIDMSGSMTRYGKYGQAKRVALSLSSLVRGKFPGDFLQFVGFYTYASPLSERELLYSAPKEVSIFDSRVHMRVNLDQPPGFVPEHFTNIQAGLQFARRVLRRHPGKNRQIITITDGEPTAHVEGREIVLIYPPSQKTAALTLQEVRRCANDGIQMSSFALIEDYFYLGLVNFVEQMAAVSGGVAAFCNASDLGNMVIDSFTKGRRKRRRIG
ncbi:MAG: VWA domain-containing protein [Planctomycetes bacterium]|nr:VWA domain-containing protein [Planctomycetota bacterium]